MLKDIIPNPHEKQEPAPASRIASVEKKEKKVNVKKEKKEKKHKSTGGVSAEAGPSRKRLKNTTAPDEDEIKAIESPSKKRKIHTVDLTNDRKPPMFINLLDSDDEDEKPVIVL